MTVWNVISTLLIGPLKLLFEVIFTIANRLIGNPGLSIIVLSLMMNILVLPLYKRADAMQEEERLIEQKLDRGVRHIKKTFKGDERMMILQTYYRQNNYKPTYVLRGAMSLFLQIPFFIAAYNFLSGLELLNGVSFGPISNLGAPDGLLVIGSFTINVLPIIMTAVNLISCVIFTKGGTLKSKLQLYAMAIFFLFFLYTSPSGLVFYWTLNNIFSLVKTIFYKLKNPKKVLSILMSAVGLALGVFGLFIYQSPTLKRTLFFVTAAIVMQIPLVITLTGIKLSKKDNEESVSYNSKLFFSGAALMAVLTGAVIPSAVIKSSPQEFIDTGYYFNPLFYILSSLCLAVGAFVIWGGVFYRLVKPKAKSVFDKAIWIICGLSIIDYMFFGKNLGNLSASLKYENGIAYSLSEQLINFLILAAAAAVLLLAFKFGKKFIPQVLVVAVAALCVMSVINAVSIDKSVQRIVKSSEEHNDGTPVYTMSKNGKNVIVLMLDRAMGEYVPYIMNEMPELKEQFDGFTYYSNTVSFGGNTNFGAPAIFGGYEYTPVEMNRRDTESLKDKQNEALKVMPVLFDSNGYDVTVFDPTYANYEWIPDLSIYDEYPNIKKSNTKGKFVSENNKKILINEKMRNFFCYSLLKTAPMFAQTTLYDRGNYNESKNLFGEGVYAGQTTFDNYRSHGINQGFMDAYSVLENLDDITFAEDKENGTFLMMTNDTTHDPQYLQAPEYEPLDVVDNSEYELENSDRYNVDGVSLEMSKEMHYAHYQTNAAALKLLGKWFDRMREMGVYDNTRIILVSDHGGNVDQIEKLVYSDELDLEAFFPLLMVKDFNAKGFETNSAFMTNGDVPTLALDGVVDSAVNPFTGKKIDSSEKSAHKQYVVTYGEWDVNKNNGNTFAPCIWYSVHDSIWDKNNWEKVGDYTVIKDY